MNSVDKDTKSGSPSLAVNIAGVALDCPLMTASGTCGYAEEYSDFVDLRQLGAFVTKSISVAPRLGNEYPRIVETRAGMLNAIGLANVGLEIFLSEKVPPAEPVRLACFRKYCRRDDRRLRSRRPSLGRC